MDNTNTKKSVSISPIVKDKSFGIFLLLSAFVLTVIDNFYADIWFTGSWDIILYIILLLPLTYLTIKNRVVNNYTKWLIPIALIFIFDMFYYNNDLVKILPTIFYIFTLLLYLSSFSKVDNFYQTFILKLFTPNKLINLTKEFIDSIFTFRKNKILLERLFKAILITLPFVIIFTALLTSADSSYSKFLSTLFTINRDINLLKIVKTPIYFFIYLSIFIYSFSTITKSKNIKKEYNLDTLVIGIFLFTINLLFLSFIAVQIPFLINGTIPSGINIANFAREGFFQLMLVIAIVALILLYIFKRYNSQKSILILVTALILQSIIMAIVSIKKMHLYQDLKGATVLRYYVEWFDYFLVAIMVLALIFFIKKFNYEKLLNIITTLALLSFTVIASINIDSIVAKRNILKFKDSPDKLDKKYLFSLSIDALPVIKEYKIIPPKKTPENWYYNNHFYSCDDFKNYHYGYCKIAKEFKL